jgi:aliphatic nitrilase
LNFLALRRRPLQGAPVFLDTDATVDKVVRLIAEAAANGARLVAFPEVFVAGYPYWNWVMNPVEASPWFEKLCKSAIEIPGLEIRKIAAAAKTHQINVVVGVNERSPAGIATIYNTLITISDSGCLIGHHRKLVPTWAEKLTGHRVTEQVCACMARVSASWARLHAARTPIHWRASACLRQANSFT